MFGRLISVLVFALVLPTSAARAAASDATAELAKLNQEATAAYGSYSFKTGLRKLDQAIALAKTRQIAPCPELSRTYQLRGIGVIAANDDLYRGLHFLTRALRLDPKAVLPQELLTPQIAAVLAGAKRALAALHQRPPTVELDLYQEKVQSALDSVRKDARGLVHEAVDEARRGYAIPLSAAAGVDIRASSFWIYFRAAGKVTFERVKMRLAQSAYRGSIPKRVTSGAYLHYYVEARDGRNRVAATHGSVRSPNVITLKD